MMGASRRHAPATWKRPVKPATSRGLQAAMAALYAPSNEPMRPDDLLAQFEQLGRDSEDRRRRQGELRLG